MNTGRIIHTKNSITNTNERGIVMAALDTTLVSIGKEELYERIGEPVYIMHPGKEDAHWDILEKITPHNLVGDIFQFTRNSEFGSEYVSGWIAMGLKHR